MPKRAPGLWANTAQWLDDFPAVDRPQSFDVAIVGGGLTGLWTAYFLLRADPTLRVGIFEAETCGFGASGRNGGWASALFPVSIEALADRYGPPAARAMYRGMIESLYRLERIVALEGIECDFYRGGTLTLGRSAAQMLRLNDEISGLRAFGFGPDDVVLLTEEEASARVAATGVLGAMYTPHCARIHPAKLVTGLARVVAQAGAHIFERSPVSEIIQGGLVVRGYHIDAELVVRATEAYTVRLPASRRVVAPVYSMMIATTPIPDELWEEIGWTGCETLTDGRRVIIYAQRTADNRIAFGGRGAPYHFGSSITDAFDEDPQVRGLLREALVELFPMLSGQEIAYHWGGPIGVPRDFMPSVGIDRARGFGWAGGYVGDGVTTTFLAGETLSHLIRGESSELTDLCWVGASSRGWEPEPLRWLGINGTLWASRQADRREVGSTLGSWQGRLADAISGA